MTKAYEAIQKFYGERRTLRSGVLLMNHIDEGLRVLSALWASDETKDAYCLHPIFQADTDLARNFYLAENFSPVTMTLVMEYRNKANAALSDRVTIVDGKPHWNGAPPSAGPLREVKEMLIADKVQNCADFFLYHLGSHPRSAELNHYFMHWHEALGVDMAMYTRLAKVMKE